MTDQEIDRRARELTESIDGYANLHDGRPEVLKLVAAALREARDAEREECAIICDSEKSAAIRARGGQS